MKILFITSDPLEYNSSANMRNRAIIKGIIENGNQVSTLSAELKEKSIYADNSKLNLELKERYWIKDSIKIRVDKEDRGKKIKKKIKEIIYNLYIKFSIYDPKKRLLKKLNVSQIENEFDLIISSSDPKSAHLLAEKLIKEKPNITKKWIQYWGDPFLDDINKKSLFSKKLIKKEEERIISLCDKIVYVSPFTLEKQKKLYNKYSDKMEFLPIPYIKEKIYKPNKNKNIVLGYFGDYRSQDRNIQPLYKLVSNNKNIQLNICGNSNLKLEQKENINIKARQPLSVIEKMEEKSDILVCICNSHGNQIPGKVYHYAATNKAILIIVDGDKEKELIEYFSTYDRYYMCYNNEKDILEKIKLIKKENIKFIPLKQLNSKNISSKIIEM